VDRDDVTGTPARDAEADRLLADYLAELSRSLRCRGALATDIEEEVADGLLETVDSYRRTGLAPAEAARAAFADFGSPGAVAAAFRAETKLTETHRLGRRLLVTGPVVAMLWLTAMLASTAPPLQRQLDPWMLLVVAVAALLVSAPAAAFAVAASRPAGRLLLATVASPAAAVSSAAATAGDVTLLVVVTAQVVLLNGHLAWALVLLAALASMLRGMFACRMVARAAPGSLSSR
jgi:hypothetical protein